MAKNIASLLKTDMMADLDLKALAQLLQSRGRGGDTILAHITQREADKLAKAGGSDTTNPDTGLPEFYELQDYYMGEPAQVAQDDYLYAEGRLPAEDEITRFGRSPAESVAPSEADAASQEPSSPAELPLATPAIPEIGFEGRPDLPGVSPYVSTPTSGLQQTVSSAQEKQEKGLFEGMTNEQKRNLLLKGALGTGAGIISALQGRRAAKAGEGAKREVQALATPYQQAGQAMQAQAQQGQLTPDRAAQMQAAQAQVAQSIQQRGGVGAQQAATQLAQFRRTLLNDQYNYGLRIAQIGDSYAQKAIATGLTQDREMSASMQGLSAALASFLGGRA